MELNRVDYALLKVLLKNDSVSFFKGMTIYEILDVLGGSRVTTYKKLNRLVKLGYVKKGCKDINGYGSEYDGEVIDLDVCCECFDKMLDKLVSQCKINPIQDGDFD